MVNKKQTRKKIIASRNVLKDYLATLERTIILIEDNKPLKDVSGFYDSNLVLFELEGIKQDIEEVLK
jgi:hypothetical protein